MACCIIAALLFAQFMGMLRRWGMFWGLVRVPEGAVVDTAYGRLAAWLGRPRVRFALAVMVAVELTGGASWLYLRHGAHIAEEADVAWSRLHGEHVVYAGVCTPDEEDVRLRLVVASRDVPPPTIDARAGSATRTN